MASFGSWDPTRLNIGTQRPSVARLTAPGRLAVLERSCYEPLADLPDNPSERFLARCLLCDKEVEVNLTTLHGADLDRRGWDAGAQKFRLPKARRGQCAHPKNPRKASLSPLTRTEARAVLKALKGGDEDRALVTALRKLHQIAEAGEVGR